MKKTFTCFKGITHAPLISILTKLFSFLKSSFNYKLITFLNTLNISLFIILFIYDK